MTKCSLDCRSKREFAQIGGTRGQKKGTFCSKLSIGLKYYRHSSSFLFIPFHPLSSPFLPPFPSPLPLSLLFSSDSISVISSILHLFSFLLSFHVFSSFFSTHISSPFYPFFISTSLFFSFFLPPSSIPSFYPFFLLAIHLTFVLNLPQILEKKVYQQSSWRLKQ